MLGKINFQSLIFVFVLKVVDNPHKSTLLDKPSPNLSSPTTKNTLMKPPKMNLKKRSCHMTEHFLLLTQDVANQKNSVVHLPVPATKSLTVRFFDGAMLLGSIFGVLSLLSWCEFFMLHVNRCFIFQMKKIIKNRKKIKKLFAAAALFHYTTSVTIIKQLLLNF